MDEHTWICGIPVRWEGWNTIEACLRGDVDWRWNGYDLLLTSADPITVAYTERYNDHKSLTLHHAEKSLYIRDSDGQRRMLVSSYCGVTHIIDPRDYSIWVPCYE